MKDGKYVVKSWAQMEAEYGLNSAGHIKDPKHDYACIWKTREEEAINEGRILEIINGRGMGRVQDDQIFLGPYIPQGTKILVRDHGDANWQVRYFWCWNANSVIITSSAHDKALDLWDEYKLIEEEPAKPQPTKSEIQQAIDVLNRVKEGLE